MAATLAFHADAYSPGTRHPLHRHDELHLSLVLSGHVTETVGRVTEWAGALSVVAKDAGVLHANDFGPAGAKLARLSLNAGTIAALVDDPARAEAWHWAHDPAAAAPYIRLVRRTYGTARTFSADDPDLLELLAAMTARRAAPVRANPPAWLAQTMDELRSDWRPGRSVQDVARRAGVHPVYLARCVRRWYGTGLGEELRRLRIRAAAAAVAELHGTVSRVAHSHGFADEPHLCRE
ncbi:MAG: helix-turn-helix domain-containing protein, partial [Gemmatimonadaceae bacterium]